MFFAFIYGISREAGAEYPALSVLVQACVPITPASALFGRTGPFVSVMCKKRSIKKVYKI